MYYYVVWYFNILCMILYRAALDGNDSTGIFFVAVLDFIPSATCSRNVNFHLAMYNVDLTTIF